MINLSIKREVNSCFNNSLVYSLSKLVNKAVIDSTQYYITS